jgi:POT family proton-dependent oligopeptide transporter
VLRQRLPKSSSFKKKRFLFSVTPQQNFLGHPRGLAYLVFAESWERFSYYGMQALLVLYMSQYLLLPGHISHVALFDPFRHAIESAYGKLSPAALASVIFGFYAGGVYLTPLAGGLLADRLLGRTRTVTIGALLMALGHFLMAFEASFLLALTFLLVGVGCFKGNIATQVGELYPPGDTRRADAFQIYQLGIAIAVIFSPLVCGTLGEKVAWHWGFGAAGIGMLAGLAVYLSGLRYLPPERPRGHGRPRAHLAPGEGRTVLVLIALLPAMVLAMLGNQQIFNAYIVWGDANYDLQLFGQAMPVTWLVSLDAVLSTVVAAGVILGWRRYERRFQPVTEITKLIIGTFIMAAASATLALASLYEARTGHKIGLAWALPFHLLNSIGFVNLFPVGLALFSRAAPHAIAGLMLGVFYTHLFVTNMLVGYLGSLLETTPPIHFWLLQAGLITAGGCLMLGFRAAFGHLLAPLVDLEAAV